MVDSRSRPDCWASDLPLAWVQREGRFALAKLVGSEWIRITQGVEVALVLVFK